VSVPWRVLLLGGSSGTGKSTTAQAIGRHLQIAVLLLDDVRIALQAISTYAQHPALHAFTADASPAYHSPDTYRAGLIAVAEALAPAVQAIVKHHLSAGDAGPLILEGDALWPSRIATAQATAALSTHPPSFDPKVRAVFLHEPDRSAIADNLAARGRGFQVLPPDRQNVITEGSWLYGNTLAGEANALGLPVVASSPFETLVNRVLSAAA
jgi:hypothetical protein